jgi:hypothetical protein
MLFSSTFSAYELYLATMAKRGGHAQVGKLPGGKAMDITDAPKSMEDKLCENFKATFSRPNVKVHFVGAWLVIILQLNLLFYT